MRDSWVHVITPQTNGLFRNTMNAYIIDMIVDILKNQGLLTEKIKMIALR